MKKYLLNAGFVMAAFFITCLAIATGAYFNSGLTMTVGSLSEIRVRAPRDTENIAETNRNRQMAQDFAENLQLVFTVDPSEWTWVENNLGIRRSELEGIREAYREERNAHEYAIEAWEAQTIAHTEAHEQSLAQWQSERDVAISMGYPIPPIPVPLPAPERPEWLGESFLLFDEYHTILFSETQQEQVVNMSHENFYEMWEAIISSAEIVQTQHMVQHFIDVMVQNQVRVALLTYSLDRATEELAEHIILHSLMNNIIPDEETNRQNFLEAINNYEVVMILEGDIIVDERQIITQEIYDALQALDMLAPESLMDNLYAVLGVFFLVAMLFLACIMYLNFYRPAITSNSREAMLLLVLYLLTISLVWTLGNLSFPFLPILIFPMLVAILIDRRCSTVLTFAVILICFFIVDGDMTYLMFYSVSSILICLFSRYTTERGKSIWTGLLISAVMFVLAIAVMLVAERNDALHDPQVVQQMFITAGFAAVAGILTVFVCMGSLPLWETFFGVVTPVKLLDLTNPTNLLLRRLTIEAPGTYHHSLIVANLAETAALDIGANAHAARVGGYYHDVGKLKFPHYFVENLDGENPHDHLDPLNSTQIIMSHVSYGLTLATEHRLPQFVRDIIREHHGTTLLQYFYSKSREKDVECDEKDFRYPYTIPQTKESACVMLADSVEAAVRSMIPKIQSVDEVEKTIRFIIRGKLNDGQLAESDLSIKDVTIIEQSFFRVLKGMYHERIAYPSKARA
ncbi:MAG: HDIG domain-containing protein [Defluviitaleaceae bacterium]|nr:HDIG domain-containing protein [Defluviitaleaceae bacterium]